MKPNFILTAVFTGLLLLAFSTQAQEMDTELAALATKLSSEISKGGKKKVAVLDFTDLQGGSSELGKYIAEELTVQLVQVRAGFSVLDRANLRKVLSEHKLTATGLVDPENAKKLGQFAGVDALILGTITPKSLKVSLTAKLITTDTAEIVGASRAAFAKDETVQQLLSQSVNANDGADERQNTSSQGSPAKPFGDLQAKVESFKFLPGDGTYGFTRLSLIVSNTSPTKTYGFAFPHKIDWNVKLTNDRGEEFVALELTGVEKGDGDENGFYGEMSEILPKSSLLITLKSRVRWDGNPGDYRPYRFQTMVHFAVQDKGRYPQLKKHNLILNIP